VRVTVTPAPVPHFVSSCTQSEPASYWGYGSQIAYVAGAPFVPPGDDEQADVAARAAAAAMVNAKMRRLAVDERMESPFSPCHGARGVGATIRHCPSAAAMPAMSCPRMRRTAVQKRCDVTPREVVRRLWSVVESVRPTIRLDAAVVNCRYP
jgi:hypothetical protein